MDYPTAINLLSSFKPNDTVRVVKEGHTSNMYVSRTFHLADYSFGSPESGRVTVTYGPGRYACEITADMLVLGLATIESRAAKFYMKDDGTGRVYFTWASTMQAAQEILTEYARSLRSSADIHDDRNENLAVEVDEEVERLGALLEEDAKLPMEITIGILDLEIGAGDGRAPKGGEVAAPEFESAAINKAPTQLGAVEIAARTTDWNWRSPTCR
jgi:hypothetical protein